MNGGIESTPVKFGTVKLSPKFIVILHLGTELYLHEVTFLFTIVAEACNYNFKNLVDHHDYNKIYPVSRQSLTGSFLMIMMKGMLKATSGTSITS